MTIEDVAKYQSTYNMLHSAADYLLWVCQGEGRWEARDLISSAMVDVVAEADEKDQWVDTREGWQHAQKWQELVKVQGWLPAAAPIWEAAQ
jgi:hypothetical protein